MSCETSVIPKSMSRVGREACSSRSQEVGLGVSMRLLA